MSLGVARKKTKPGLDGAGGRYVPTSTSRAWAGGSGALDSTAVSAAPSTNSLLWLATATSGGAGRGTAASWTAEATPCGGEAQHEMAVGTGSRSEVKSGEKTDDEAIFLGGPKSRAEQRVLARQKRLIHQYHTHHTTPRAPAIFWSSPNSQAPGGRAHARLGSVLSSSASVQDKIELPGPGSGVRSGREREGVARASSMAPAAVAAPVASVSPGGGAVRSARRIASLHPCHSSSKCHCYSLAFSSSPSC